MDNVTGATIEAQSQSGIQVSNNTGTALAGQAAANLSVNGHFDPALPDPSTMALNALELQDVTLNGQTCSLTGTQPIDSPSPSPALGPSAQPLVGLTYARLAAHMLNRSRNHHILADVLQHVGPPQPGSTATKVILANDNGRILLLFI